jgi:hypothetical protein
VSRTGPPDALRDPRIRPRPLRARLKILA